MILLLIATAFAGDKNPACPGMNVIYENGLHIRATKTEGAVKTEYDRTIYQSRCGIAIWTEPNGPALRVVVGTDERRASVDCDGLATRDAWRPTIFEDGSARFVCYAHGKAQVVRREGGEWNFGPVFNEFGPNSLSVGGRDFYAARRGSRWHAVWGKEVSESHGAIEVGSDCQSPFYLAADEDGYRVYAWGKPPSPPEAATKPKLPACTVP